MYITYLYILIIHVSSSVDGIYWRMFDLSDYICLSHLVCIPSLGCLKKKSRLFLEEQIIIFNFKNSFYQNNDGIHGQKNYGKVPIKP